MYGVIKLLYKNMKVFFKSLNEWSGMPPWAINKNTSDEGVKSAIKLFIFSCSRHSCLAYSIFILLKSKVEICISN